MKYVKFDMPESDVDDNLRSVAGAIDAALEQHNTALVRVMVVLSADNFSFWGHVIMEGYRRIESGFAGNRGLLDTPDFAGEWVRTAIEHCMNLSEKAATEGATFPAARPANGNGAAGASAAGEAER